MTSMMSHDAYASWYRADILTLQVACERCQPGAQEGSTKNRSEEICYTVVSVSEHHGIGRF